jgi:DNA-binding Lrp family transcriptional regulator
MENERGFLGVWIPKEIYLHNGLTPTEKLLLAEITCLHGSGSCFASNQHFAEFLGISKSQVSRLITKLSRMGFISVEMTYVEGTKEVDKRYLTPICFEKDTPTHECVYPLRIDAYTPTNECVDPLRVDAYYKEQDKKQVKEQEKDLKINKKNVPNSEYEAEFETIWGNYPKKVGKKKALLSYIKARKVNKYTYETIKLGLERYIRHLEDTNEDYKFIQEGKTWFNGEGWNDDYTSPKLNRKAKNAAEYWKQKYGEENHGQTRDRKVVNLHPESLPEPLQGL